MTEERIIKLQRQSLEGAISHMRCILQEPWQSVESQRIARENIANYRIRLDALDASPAA